LTNAGRHHLNQERQDWGRRAEIVRTVLSGEEVANGLV